MNTTADTFDYVIVGAGSAGCVLANRLTEDSKVTVCLLEAAGPDKSPLIHVPMGVVLLPFNKNWNWNFFTAPQAGSNDRKIYVPRGRALGGSSSINGMIYIRGHRLDFDEWAAAGNPGWAWDEVKPYFIKSENNEQFGGDGYHGTGGPLNVTHIRSASPLVQDLIAAGESFQYPHNPDFNGERQEGFGQFQTTTRNGRRASTAVSFLEPVRRRPNLTVLTHAPAHRILLEDGRAAGVVAGAPGGGTRTVRANREVIVSAGSFISPKLLMLSGIGDADRLKSLGIAVAHHLPGVGRNLQDHASIAVYFHTRSTTPYGLSLRSIPWFAGQAVSYLFRRDGIFASNIVEMGGFIRTSPELERPDIQVAMFPVRRARPPRLIGWGHGFSLGTILLRPKSRGTVTLGGTGPDDDPVIDPRLFDHPDDMAVMLRGFKQVRRIAHSEAFAKYGPKEVNPGPEIQDDDALGDYIRAMCSTAFHPVGTCKMGPDGDPDAVLDARLQVRGVRGLRVADASIMPTVNGGNTNAPTIMIGEKAADMIKEDARA